MIRLREQGLVENIREQTHQGHAKAWRLTVEGEDVVRANPPLRPSIELTAGGAAGTGTFSSGRKDAAGVKSPVGLAEGRTVAPIGARRVTDRTRLVLSAVAELGTRDFAPSNRQVSRAAGVRDQGQISKLLGRLEQQGFLHNSGGQTQGIPNAWRLTPRGEEVLSAVGHKAARGVPR